MFFAHLHDGLSGLFDLLRESHIVSECAQQLLFAPITHSAHLHLISNAVCVRHPFFYLPGVEISCVVSKCLFKNIDTFLVIHCRPI